MAIRPRSVIGNLMFASTAYWHFGDARSRTSGGQWAVTRQHHSTPSEHAEDRARSCLGGRGSAGGRNLHRQRHVAGNPTVSEQVFAMPG